MSALSLMATGENKRLQVREDDVVVISAHPIPGNEWSVGQVIDELHRRGADVIHSGTEAVHVSGHARQGELATLMSVAKPAAFVPVHGEYRHMVHHARLAASAGIDPSQIILCEDGDLVLVEPTPAGYREKARVKLLTSPCRAQLALADGRLYARDSKKLICEDMRK